MVSRAIPFIVGATLLSCAAVAGAGPSDTRASPDPALQAYYNKHGPDKYQAGPSDVKAPANPALQAYYTKHGPGKWQAARSEATAPAGAFLQSQ